jgi:hypothetical protein
MPIYIGEVVSINLCNYMSPLLALATLGDTTQVEKFRFRFRLGWFSFFFELII